MTDLHVFYRPQTFDEVVGQDHVVESLKGFQKSGNWPHAFLFTGPSGSGKTTLGRIIAGQLGCTAANLTEIDAASNNSVDDIRALTSGLMYASFGESPTKVFILDECHSYSKPAWQALLKSLEEPPQHVYFILCTTEADKIPETIKTRCITYNLRAVAYDILTDLLEAVADAAGISLTDRMLQLIAQEAKGSPRRALTLLAKSREVTTIEELRDVLESIDENKTVIELCRLLVRGGLTWKKAVELVKNLEEVPPETVRLTVINYVTKVLLSTQQEEKAGQLLAILDSFSTTTVWNQSEKKAPLLLALGRLVL